MDGLTEDDSRRNPTGGQLNCQNRFPIVLSFRQKSSGRLVVVCVCGRPTHVYHLFRSVVITVPRLQCQWLISTCTLLVHFHLLRCSQHNSKNSIFLCPSNSSFFFPARTDHWLPFHFPLFSFFFFFLLSCFRTLLHYAIFA